MNRGVKKKKKKVILPVSKSSLDEDDSAASKSSTEPIKRMVSVTSKTCGSVHSGTAPRSFIHTQGLPYCCGMGTGTYLVDAQALACPLMDSTVDNAMVTEDITCANFEMALNKRPDQSYIRELWSPLWSPSSSIMSCTFIQGVLSCESHGNSTAKQLAAFESSAPAPACFSLMNNTMSSAVILPISKSSLDDDNYAASKSTTEHIKRMVSVICKTCGSVHSGTAPRCFIRTQGLPHGKGTSTFLVCTQALACPLMDSTVDNAMVTEDITCANFEMALNKRPDQSYIRELWSPLWSPSSSIMSCTFIQGVLSCESHGNSAAKQLAAFESSAPAPACFSLVNNNKSSAVILPISKSSLDEDDSAANKSSTESIKRMVSVTSKTCGSVLSGTAPRSFIRTQGLPYCYGMGTGTYLVDAQALTCPLMDSTVDNAMVIEDITCTNFEVALNERPDQSYSSSLMPWTFIQDVTSCESHGSTFVAVEESSAQAATHSSLVVNKWSADTVSKSSLDEEESAASKSSTKPTKRMVSVPSETFESVHSGTAPRSFVHTQEVTHDSEDIMTIPGSPVPEVLNKSFPKEVIYQDSHLDQSRRLKDFKCYHDYHPGTIIFNSTETVTSIQRGKCLGRKKDVFLSKCKEFVMKKRNCTVHLNMWIHLHHHDHVMPLLGVMTAGPDGLYEITEHMNCDLRMATGCVTLKQLAEMLTVDQWTYTQRNISHIVRSILKGIIHLNNHGFQHYDLKEDNVFVSKPSGCNCATILTCTCREEWIIKVGDFDTLNIIMRPKSWHCGTEFYHPPETEGGEQYDIKYGNPVYDSWSIGIIILHLCDGINFKTSYKNAREVPWLKNHECHYAKDRLLCLMDSNNRRLFPVIKFAKHCLQDNLNERPTPSKLLDMWN